MMTATKVQILPPASDCEGLINILFTHPYTKNSFLERELRIHRNTASNYLNILSDNGLLKKVKEGRSNYYINEPLLKILKER